MVDVLNQNQTFADPSDALAHFGVKGMKWGVRKDRAGSGESVSSGGAGSGSAVPEKKSSSDTSKRVKQVAIGLGVLTAVAGAAYLTYQVQQNGNRPVRPSAKADKGAEMTKKILQEPTTPILGSRGKNLGYRFVETGGIPTPVAEWERAGFDGATKSPFRRYGDNQEKAAVTLSDPDGRKDHAGRPIEHDIIVPAALAKGINNENDVREKIWPLVKESYDKFYAESEARRT